MRRPATAEARGLEGLSTQMLVFPYGSDGRADVEIRGNLERKVMGLVMSGRCSI